jgi:hypothetical protein
MPSLQKRLGPFVEASEVSTHRDQEIPADAGTEEQGSGGPQPVSLVNLAEWREYIQEKARRD